METLSSPDDLERLYLKFLELEPKLISATVPANAVEQKSRFLANEIEQPHHLYPKLQEASAANASIQQSGDALLGSPQLDTKHAPVYQEFVAGYLKKARLMELMNAVTQASSSAERELARDEFMRINTELYGEPEKITYTSLLQEKMVTIAQKKLEPQAQVLFDELREILPLEYHDTGEVLERFRPQPKTVEWVHGAVTALYGDMLRHVPEQDEFNVPEVQAIFGRIIADEFGDAAAGWRVDVEPAKSITVKSSEKRVVIPEDRGTLTSEMLKKLIVHELGVHVLRSVTGETTDIGPLRTGLADYYEAEEGLGKVMEQALVGRFGEAGIDHYITAGAAYYDNMNFREVFEVKWRLGLLSKLEDGEQPTDEKIEAARSAAYSGVMRIYRGTDELPWFKDLAYYNGSVEVWKFLEEICGDDQRLTLLLMGKINTSTNHLQSILEAKTVR